jgi:hypothetical protein
MKKTSIISIFLHISLLLVVLNLLRANTSDSNVRIFIVAVVLNLISIISVFLIIFCVKNNRVNVKNALINKSNIPCKLLLFFIFMIFFLYMKNIFEYLFANFSNEAINISYLIIISTAFLLCFLYFVINILVFNNLYKKIIVSIFYLVFLISLLIGWMFYLAFSIGDFSEVFID